jgi:site-specific recombinase XerD
MTISYMHKRRGYWYYIRRVPLEARAFETRPFVLKSTKIRIGDDPRGVVARVRIQDIDSACEARWQDLIAGIDPDARARYQRNLHIAGEHRLPYLIKPEIAALPDEDFLHRLQIVASKPSPELASAMFGTISPPGIKLSRLLDEYCKLNAASLAMKSANQLQKWRVARETSIQVFMSVNQGDMDLSKITRSHVLAYRNHWNQQAVEGRIQIGSANKYIGRFSSIVKAVAEAHQLGISTLFEKIYISGEKTGKRQSFETEWVQTVLLAEGALDSLNDEARAIIYLITETGLRLVEACNLTKSTIKLDHKIPHIQVRPEGRQLKTDQSERDIPLVGVALMAMKQHPEGFPRYRDKNATASALINKFLKSRFKIEGSQTLYSLRHTFKNRLRSARCQDEISVRLMGHDYDLPEYGEPSLEDKLYWLRKIAFKPPTRI